MHKLLLLTVFILIFCLSGCITQAQSTDTSTMNSTVPAAEANDASETFQQTPGTPIMTVTDIVPLYDTSAADWNLTPAKQQNPEIYEAAYYHFDTTVSFLQENLIKICTDEQEYNQGSHYAVYEIANGEFHPLENKKFLRDYEIFGSVYRIEFEYTVYNGEIILTYVPHSGSSDIYFEKCLSDQTYLLELIDSSDLENTVHPLMVLDIETGELTDYLKTLEPELRQQIIRDQTDDIAFLDKNRFIISKFNGSFYYVDLVISSGCQLNSLIGEELDHAFIAGESIVCYNTSGDFWKIDTADLTYKQLLTGIEYFNAGTLDERYDTSYIVYLFHDEYHIYDTVNEQDHIIVIPEGWDFAPESLHTSPNGKRTYSSKLEGKQYQVLILNFETPSFTELLRNNKNNVTDIHIAWANDGKLVISAEKHNDRLDTEYFVYDFK